jgi:hypothetical protein
MIRPTLTTARYAASETTTARYAASETIMESLNDEVPKR